MVTWLTKEWFLWIALTLNAIGAVLGYWWYAGQIQRTLWYLIPFVPDSPLSVTFFIIAMWLTIRRSHSRLRQVISAVAVTWMMKYGLWCVYILLFARATGSSLYFEGWLLIVTHFLMAFEAVLYANVIRFLRFDRTGLLIALVTLLINDYGDYVYGVFPYLPKLSMLPMMTVVTPLLTLLIITFCLSTIVVQKVNPSPSTS